MIFLLVTISILSFRTALAIDNRTIIVDWAVPVSEVMVFNPNSYLKFVCLSVCRWIVPERIRDNNQVSLVGNDLSVIFRNNQDSDGNITVCKSSSQFSDIEYYEIPRCCPCCNWYNQRFCDGITQKYENCSILVIYSFIAADIIMTSYYENTLFLLPCKLPSFRFSQLIIRKMNKPRMILYDSNQTVYPLHEHISYNAASGLCFNTSILKPLTLLQCDYAETFSISYSLMKTDLKYKNIQSKLYLIQENTNVSLQIPEQFPLLLSINQTVRLLCHANYSGKPLNVLICMKFDFGNEIQKKEFYCEEDSKGVSLPLIINTSTLKNLSKVICDIQTPSKINPKRSELQIQLFEKERFELLNVQEWNNTIKPVEKSDKEIKVNILFYSVPATLKIKCQMLQTSGIKLQVSCSILVVGKCVCTVRTDVLFKTKQMFNLSILIYNEKIRKKISTILKPIYLQSPKVLGLTQILESYKQIRCESDSSEPFQIKWELQFDNQPKIIYYSIENDLIIKLNDSIGSICVLCSISNDVGSKTSKRICQNLIDLDIKPNLPFQLFLFNATIWNKKSKSVETINQITLTNHSVEILDIEPIIIICGSRNKEQNMNIYFNQTRLNTTEVVSKYTKQSIFKFHPKTIENKNYSGNYICQENISQDKLKIGSTIYIKVIQTIAPKLKVKFENDELKTGFRIGLDLRLYVDILNFPHSKVDVYSSISHDFANLTMMRPIIIYDRVDSTHLKVKIIFSNLSHVDSIKYMIVAHNIAGKDTYVFSLEASNSHNLKIYYVIAAILVVLVMTFGILVRFFHKSGYAVPIIQIPNSMYKSLDVDSVQLINNIWFDPLERKRWTIKPSSKIKIIKEIGSGNYGKIYKGILAGNGSEQLVALKQPILTKQSGKGKLTGSLQFCQVSLDCFINEIRVLSKLTECPNIIKMFGCVVFLNGIEQETCVNEPTTLLVLEYYTNRSLNEFLTKNSVMFSPYTKFRKLTELNGYTGMKMDEGITLLDLKKISLGIATGLEYLSGLNIIHRDLATRNILIDEQKNPKICDFGLAIELENEVGLSSMYQILTHQKALPFKILPPEVLELKSFCLESDIWSFGLLLWQMFNLEQESLFPQYDNPVSLLKYIRNRLMVIEVQELLPVPKYADESMWQLIKKCWAFEPFNRPSSHILKLELMEIVRNSPVEVIRVSSDNQPEKHEETYRDSIGSSKFPSTRTSIITLNYPNSLPFTNSSTENSYFFDEFSNETLINEESPL